MQPDRSVRVGNGREKKMKKCFLSKFLLNVSKIISQISEGVMCLLVCAVLSLITVTKIDACYIADEFCKEEHYFLNVICRHYSTETDYDAQQSYNYKYTIQSLANFHVTPVKLCCNEIWVVTNIKFIFHCRNVSCCNNKQIRSGHKQSL